MFAEINRQFYVQEPVCFLWVWKNVTQPAMGVGWAALAIALRQRRER